MKKIALLTLLFVILSNCEIKTRQTTAQSKTQQIINRFYDDSYGFQYHEEERDGMRYGIWSQIPQSYNTGYAVTVVNLTKETLEVELLKLQIAKLHQELHPNP